MAIKSIEELISMKVDKEKELSELHTMYLKSLDTEIKFRKCTRLEGVKINKMPIEDQLPYLIYTHVVEPDLKNKELQQAYGCMKPYDIVDKLITDLVELNDLREAIFSGKVKEGIDLTDEIKN